VVDLIARYIDDIAIASKDSSGMLEALTRKHQL